MVIVKWSDVIESTRVKVDDPMCWGLYKEDRGSIVPWSVKDPESKMNYLT